jgi:hypothetical protein
MGHQRLGRLKHTLRWNEVVGLLEEEPRNAPAVAQKAALASDSYLLDLKNDASLNYCFWLLTRLTWAARGAGFVEQLQKLGLRASEGTPTLAFLAAVADHTRNEISQHPESAAAGEFASLAIRRALTETVGTIGPSLFGSTVADLQTALRTYSTPERFGELAQRFFGDFMARTMRSYVDREVPNLTGTSAGIQSIAENAEVVAAIDRYARESAFILREFSGGWYSKNNWQSQGEISREQSGRFVAYALQKLRSELKREALS